jgi:hypothetical protein
MQMAGSLSALGQWAGREHHLLGLGRTLADNFRDHG